jgi:hypothetical protein
MEPENPYFRPIESMVAMEVKVTLVGHGSYTVTSR